MCCRVRGKRCTSAWVHLYADVLDTRDLLGKLARVDREGRNSCRNLHRLLRVENQSLPIPIHTCPVREVCKKPLRAEQLDWPIIRLDSWAHYILRYKPTLLLGGYMLNEVDAWTSMFRNFWDDYKVVNAAHPCFNDCHSWEGGLSRAVPYMVHGDEGRGLHRRPFLLISMQPVISHLSANVCNESTPLGSVSSCTERQAMLDGC